MRRGAFAGPAQLPGGPRRSRAGAYLPLVVAPPPLARRGVLGRHADDPRRGGCLRVRAYEGRLLLARLHNAHAHAVQDGHRVQFIHPGRATNDAPPPTAAALVREKNRERTRRAGTRSRTRVSERAPRGGGGRLPPLETNRRERGRERERGGRQKEHYLALARALARSRAHSLARTRVSE